SGYFTRPGLEQTALSGLAAFARKVKSRWNTSVRHRSTPPAELTRVTFSALLLFTHQRIIRFRLLDTDQAVAVGVDLAEQFLAPEPFLAGDAPVPFGFHLGEP